MIDLERIFPNGAVDPELIFIILFLAHLVAATVLVSWYFIRRRHSRKREAVIKDTIDALLEEHSLEEASEAAEDEAIISDTSHELESVMNHFNEMTKQEFVQYLGQYFEAAEYRIVYLPEPTSNSSKFIPQMILSKSGNRGVVLVDQPKTGVTGLPLVRGYYNQNSQKIGPTDSLIIITTGSLSPKAIEFCQALARPIIIISGHQLASSVKQLEAHPE